MYTMCIVIFNIGGLNNLTSDHSIDERSISKLKLITNY